MIDCNEWKTEKLHECTNMGKVKRLKLWWQLYVMWLPVRDLENFRAMDFCSVECTSVFPCQYHSTSAPYSHFVPLSTPLYDHSNWHCPTPLPLSLEFMYRWSSNQKRFMKQATVSTINPTSNGLSLNPNLHDETCEYLLSNATTWMLSIHQHDN